MTNQKPTSILRHRVLFCFQRSYTPHIGKYTTYFSQSQALFENNSNKSLGT